MSDILLIAGLGNPGKQYENTRHNAGFMVLDALADKLGASFSLWQGGQAAYAKTEISGKTAYLLKPLTYMNLSGQAVSSLARFFKIPPQNVVVVFDDMDIALGTIRLRKQGSAGGQNGMKNIIEQLGTQEIPRLRIGIGPKPHFFDSKDFVLSRFSSQDEKLFKEAKEKAIEAIENISKIGVENAMNKANQK